MLYLLAVDALADLSDIITNIGTAATWFWTHFTNLLEMIMTNPLLLWTVALGIGSSVIFAVVKVVKKFGIRGKRFR